jgi:hypothetical protein
VPRQFTDAQHTFDYCNVANYWMRSTSSPYQPRILYLMANFINDAARANKLHSPVPIEDVSGDVSLAALDEAILAFDIPRATALATAYVRSGADRAAYQARVLYLMANFINDAARANKLFAPVPVEDVAGEPSLGLLDEAILAFDIPRATAVASAYLKRGGDRRAYQAQVALTACKFQDDPHNQKITHSSFEEYGHNSTHLRDRLLVSPVRLLAGWPKMPGERECFARWEKEWSHA